MASAFDCIVVGGGILGTSTVYHLVRGGARALLVDRADEGRATAAGAGIASPYTDSGDSEAWANLALAAFDHLAGVVEDLESAGFGPTGYARCGFLAPAISDDELEPFGRARTVIFQRQRERADGVDDDPREMSAAEARELFPPLAIPKGAIYTRRATRLDGRLLNSALLAAASANGLVAVDADVDRLLLDGGRVTGVACGPTSYQAPAVVIAGGAWSAAFADQLDFPICVTPQRGQIIHLGLPEDVDTSSWPIVSAFRPHYMVPWPDHRVVVGATRETGSGYDAATTAAGIIEVLSEALRVAPGLASAQIREIRVGLRPLSDDGLPLIGPVPGVEGLFLNTGHGPTGLQLGSYCGRLVTEMVQGRSPALEVSPFEPARFV